MSKKSRQKKNRRLEAARRQTQQMAIATAAKAPEGAARPSIAQLVLQRIDKLGVIQTVDKSVDGEAGTTTVAPSQPAIKVAPIPDGRGMPTVPSVEEKWPENWPLCPPTCNKLEWRRALENKEYYELKALEDDLRKPWFQYPKYQYQYSEFVYCTPDMMQELLKYMPINRNFKDQWADAIARDILNDRWLQTHESIAINTLGNMHDGQHRAHGLIRANKGWPIYITWNVPPEAIYVTDSGEKRKINEKLALLFPESKLTQKTAALCRAMMWGLTSRGVRYSESEIAEFAYKHHNVILWVATSLRGYRADLQAVVAKSLLWWGEAVVKPFIDRLKAVEFHGEGDPAKALYLWLQKARQQGRRTAYTNPLIYYKKALAALHAHANAKAANKIYQRQDDVFEWLPGWEVPPDAPCGGKVFINEPPSAEEAAAALKDNNGDGEE